MRFTVYTKSTATRAEVFDVIETATSSLLAAAGELSRFPWTSSTSQIVDEALHIATLVDELKATQEPEQLELPGNVVTFVARGRRA